MRENRVYNNELQEQELGRGSPKRHRVMAFTASARRNTALKGG
jgi:hypothetical protein